MGAPSIDIAGAGPAGLAAAIVLARRGHAVRVFERSSQVGRRFNDDLQGLENWSRREDCLDELRAFGIEPNWWHRSFAKGDLYDKSLRLAQVRSSRPLFYYVRRGAAFADSLDRALLRQAQQAGVEVHFGHKADPSEVRIFAGGPSGRPMAVVRGLTFRADRPDVACTILSEALAPKGYIYFLVADGQATLATVLLDSFAESNTRLALAVATIERLYGLRVPTQASRWGGYACFAIPDSCCRAGTLIVGEAAGFQDALFGFGIRTAMVSGALAALSITEGIDYDAAWHKRIHPHLKAAQVNRAIYERLGIARTAFWHLMRAMPEGGVILRHLYGYSPLHRLAAPLAWAHGRSAAGDRPSWNGPVR